MFKFIKEQKIFEIKNIKIGGQPGELPTVLIGSLFHVGHKIVKDQKLGIFDKHKAEALIKIQEEMSEKTGIPCMLDVVGENSNALIKYIEFISGITDIPFLINGPDKNVRITAAKYAIEIGLKDRAIYNSINYTLNDEEIKAIEEIGLKTAIIQAFNPKNPTPQGMIMILKNLLDKASKAGIEKPLVFMPVLDIPSIGFAIKGIYLAKEEFGLPIGTAPCGVIGRWNKVEELGQYTKRLCRAGAISIAQIMGANFIIYGSINKARNIFPVSAMIDAIIAYSAKSFGIKPITKNHPLYKIF